MNILGSILIFSSVLLYLVFGTLSPCGMVREVVRKQDSFVALLPDALIDAALVGYFGAMSPGRCLGVLIGYATHPSTPIAPQAGVNHAAVSVPQSSEKAILAAGKITEIAVSQCRARRLSGELKSYVDSVKCSNPQMVHAFQAANYRYMDLISLYASTKLVLAKQIDRHEISEAQAQVENKKTFAQIQELERRRDAAK